MYRWSFFGGFLLLIAGVSCHDQTEFDGRSMLQDFRNRFMSYEYIENDECPFKYLRNVYTDYCHVALVKKNDSICLGVLVYDNYILTTASCVPQDWKSVQVQLQSGFDLPVVDRLVYSKYETLNISSASTPILLRINGTVNYSIPYEHTAACLWPKDNVVTYSKVQDVAYDKTLDKLIQNTTVCSSATQEACLKKTFTEWCARRPSGSILQIRDLDHYSMHPMVAGLFCDDQNQLVPVSSYASWIREVIASDRIVFVMPNSGMGEKCITRSDKEGVCLTIDSCPQVYKALTGKARNTDRLEQCGFEGKNMLHCCLTDEMLRAEDKRDKLKSIEQEIELCHELYEVHRRTTKEQQTHSQLALLQNEAGESECIGTLIAKSFVLTAAQCVQHIKSQNYTVMVGKGSGDKNLMQTRQIKSILIHPKFEHQSNHYNLAIITVSAPFTIMEYSVPACLWSDKNRMPVRLTTTGYHSASDAITVTHDHLLYYMDCRLKHYSNLTLTESCILPEIDEGYCEEERTACAESGTGLFSTIYMSADWRPVNFLVGVYSTGAQCAQGKPAIYTRVSEYYPWIRSQLYLMAQDI
ncbi:CLIP domain-containing serine protease B4-like [Anopheles ziemanni]|uniref:CLIP domain-containing serine protease B4-like n=1 Tax=Anopheles coustani TaxID=139045 RepID=UPI0026595F8E|nr:CLIP domain-containing serine protease B4-like [Anopheles coustani]XP_058168902.1 CLIP domain-containing serine protease B4-like [Anopheles ziemanni]